MSNWNYGDAYLRHPIEDDQKAIFNDGSIVAVHNIFEPLPSFMHKADVIFVDPPWNLGNLNTFYTKAEMLERVNDFKLFYNRLFKCIFEINPHICYTEIGKEYLSDFIQLMKKHYSKVTFYNSSYYHKKENMCYVVRGSNKRIKLPLDYMDEEDIISWICANEDYNFIGDLCIGRGLVAVNAAKNNKQFVGTELNKKRVSVTLERLSKLGKDYTIRIKDS